MSWFNVWDGLKNKTCRYLLQRYLGQFLDENLNLEQLNIELYNGKATIKNVSLRVDTLNELLEGQGWPLEFTGGHIGQLSLSVPWNALMTNDSSIEVSDVEFSIRPVRREHDGSSMIESMWSSVSSSLQLAEEYIRQEESVNDASATPTTAIGGLEKFAETIDNVLNRIRAKFTNITIKIEHPLGSCLKGVAFKIHLDGLVYKNETGNEKNSTQSSDNLHAECADVLNRIPTYTKHNVTFSGVHIYTQELKPGPSLELEQLDIPIIKMLAEQHVQIKVKQSEDITGPKIYFYIELGAICGICTPHQIHMMLKFLEAFTEDKCNQKQLNACYSPPEMVSANERDTYETMGGILNSNTPNAWIGTDDFHPNTNNTTHMQTTHTAYRNYHEKYCESMASSSASSRSTLTSVSRCQRKPTNLDTSGEISNFVVKVASLVLVVLHEDIVVESASNHFESIWNERSLSEQMHVSSKFFDCLEYLKKEEKDKLIFCERNHMLLRMNPVVAEGKQNRNKNVIQITTTICVTQLDICEILEGKAIHLLEFNQRNNTLQEYQFKPEISMTITSTNFVKLKNNSSTNVNIELAQCCVDFDISIIDRLGALLAPSPFSKPQNSRPLDGSDVAAKPSNTKINVTCSTLDFNLRFPIVDLKPAHDPNRVPWWKQNIRADFLLLAFEQLNVKYCNSQVQLSSSEINIYYCEDKEKRTHILNTRLRQTPADCAYPQLIVDINDHETISNKTKGAAPSLPFSSKRNCRQSSTTASSSTKADSNDFTETILLPGETHEINDFCTKSMCSSVIGVHLNLPELSLYLESKQLFEIIYNRLNSDLFMWEPSSPFLTTTPTTNDKQFLSMQNFGLMDSVYISAISQNNPFDSIYEPKEKQQFKNVMYSTHDELDNENDEADDDEYACGEDDRATIKDFSACAKISQTHRCSVEIKVGHATASIFVPVRDAENHILPEVCGKFHLNANRLKIFLLNGYCEDPCRAFFCLQVKDVELYHGGIVPMNYPLRFDHTKAVEIEEFMKSTIYKIPHGLTKGITVSNDADSDMVTVVIEIKKNLEQHLKRLKITAGLKNTTLRYMIPSSPSQFWLNQLIDFLDVLDYPIEGYIPYNVISEMQLHLSECAIDFRPDNFPFRAVIELFYFSVSSNIISAVSGCNLRFVLEECVLSVAPHDTLKEMPGNKVTFINSKDLVPVLDFGLLEISLRFSEKSDKSPKFDLRCSLQDVHLRTCFDSGSAFALLIGYIANNVAKDEELCDKSSLQSSLSSEADIFQTEVPATDEAMNKHQERVNILMAEAVKDGSDNLDDSDSELTPKEDDLKLFYFPDESHRLCNNDIELACALDDTMVGEPLASVKDEFGIIADKTSTRENKNHCSSDEDYCIIVSEEKVHTEFEDIHVSDDPLRIVDNHFTLPTSHNDILNAPPSFPVPDLRYTLCEMTVTWHLYGGHDFVQRTEDIRKEKSTIAATPMSDAYRHGVSYSNNQVSPAQGKKPKEKLTWKSRGGQERNHEVLVEIQLSKVRFSYEVYPQQTEHASRQVFLVNELEIRDRLQSSEFNKFLYNASPNNFSNRNMKHMVVVKSLHIRPNPQQSPAQECSLRISLSPLRLHIDQDTLEFITDFFTNFGKCCDTEQDSNVNESEKTRPPLPAPTLCNETEVPEAVQDLRARRIVNENLSILIDDKISDNASVKSSKSSSITSETSASAPTYFREIVFTPDISICFDYHGRRVELSKGPVAGLLMGLGQLQCSEIVLRKIVYRRGILGFEKVFNYLCKEWLRDIKRNQLPKILSGVGPTYAFVQLFQGIYDLFWLPIEHYQKDGRIIRGLQLGAQSFSARTILAALEITSRLIQLLQFTAETAFDMVSPGPSVRQLKKAKRGNKRRTHRPKDIREGVVNAYQIVKDGINDSANNLIETAVAEHDQKGLTGAVGAVMRQVPQLVVCPAVLATQATTNILGGVKSSLVPESKIEAKKKWKDDNC